MPGDLFGIFFCEEYVKSFVISAQHDTVLVIGGRSERAPPDFGEFLMPLLSVSGTIIRLNRDKRCK